MEVTGIRSRTKVFFRPQPIDNQGVDQHSLVFERDYVVADGKPRGAPTLGVMAQSVAHARSWTPYEGLGAVDEVSIGATARWFPDETDIVARPDLGSDMYEWQPRWGAAPGWRMHAASAPFVDPSYEYWARREQRKTTQAMVFSGDQWAQSGLGAAEGAFSFIIVAVLHHPRIDAWQDILSSPSAATDAHRATDCVLRYHNSVVQTWIGGRLGEASLHPPTHKQRLRPTILLWSEGAKGGTLGVVSSQGRHFHDYAHKNKVGFDLRLFLANNGAFPTAAHAADIDVLEISYFDHRLTTSTGRPKLVRLDHAYGVSGR